MSFGLFEGDKRLSFSMVIDVPSNDVEGSREVFLLDDDFLLQRDDANAISLFRDLISICIRIHLYRVTDLLDSLTRGLNFLQSLHKFGVFCVLSCSQAIEFH